MMLYQAILFDMDGVIIDTRRPVTEFWRGVGRRHGVELSQADFDRHVYGCPAGQILDRFFSHLERKQHRAIVEEMLEVETRLDYTPIRGVLPFLEALKGANIPAVLVTGSERAKTEEVMAQLGLAEFFVASITATDIERGKPAPDCYLRAARYVGAPPERCIVFEDAISGVEAAVAAGALCVGVQRPSRAGPLLQAGARLAIPNFEAVGLAAGPEGVDFCLHLDSACSLGLVVR